jgi:UDP-N-acetylglucosamine--N-acetylmuramyl-(pentapeptide) pyrophosphoryl-undecaprenol N-acetylglucosamine transferase
MTIGMTTIVLCSGGTGGHLFPAESLAKGLLARGYRVALLTDARAEGFADAASGVEIYRLDLHRSGKTPMAKITAAASILRGLFQAMGHLNRLSPALVIGFGGYPSFPGVMAAQLMAIATLIDEQNTVMGRANRVLAPLATAIATSFAKVEHIPRHKQIYVGHPVRASFESLRQILYTPPAPGEHIRILVTGGSQGATIFGKIVPDAIARLPEDLRRRLHITQQVRADDLERVAAQYRDMGVEAETASFFPHLATHLAAAHLAIGRSGASTVIESAIAGRPSIFVPLPHSISDEQTSNAWVMEEAGAAIMIKQTDFTADYLATRLQALLTDPERLTHMAQAARQAGKPGAVDALADMVVDIIEGKQMTVPA